MIVEVYRNLNKGCFSVRHKGKVIDYSSGVVLRDAKFVVRKGGRKRVLDSGQKNVHAFVRGRLVRGENFEPSNEQAGVAITYDPYKYDTFVKCSDKKPVFNAEKVALFFDVDDKCKTYII